MRTLVSVLANLANHFKHWPAIDRPPLDLLPVRCFWSWLVLIARRASQRCFGPSASAGQEPRCKTDEITGPRYFPLCTRMSKRYRSFHSPQHGGSTWEAAGGRGGCPVRQAEVPGGARPFTIGGGGGSARIEAIRPFPRQERNRARPPVTPSTRRFPVAAISHRYRLRTQPVSMRTAATTLCMWKNNDKKKKKDGRSRTVVPRAVNLRIKGSVWRPIQPFSATSLYLVESGELLNKKATPSE